MGDGVTGSVNAPVNQINARHSSPLTDPAARLEFDNALEQQEQQCPEGLGRRSPYDPPCTYLRNPSLPPPPSKPPVDLRPKGDDPSGSNGPPNGPKGIDTTPIPQQPSNSPKVPEGPNHNGGLDDGTKTDDGRNKTDDGTKTHIFGWKWRI
jgi:hypothetical protein